MSHLRVRVALVVALLSMVADKANAQCLLVDPETYAVTSAGRIRLDVLAEREWSSSGAWQTLVRAFLNRADDSGKRPDARILNIRIRRDSTWSALRLEPFNEKTHGWSYAIGRDGPAWDPGTVIDVVTEWQLRGEERTRCSLLRATITSISYVAPTVIFKESIARDSSSVAKNVGQLAVRLRDANNPLATMRDQSRIAIDTTATLPVTTGRRQIFAQSETDTIRFNKLPARQVAVTVSTTGKQYFKALVDIVAGCETVMEVYMAPESGMHSPPVTSAHATVTTCAPIRCLGGNNVVIPCDEKRMPFSRPPIMNTRLERP